MCMYWQIAYKGKLVRKIPEHFSMCWAESNGFFFLFPVKLSTLVRHTKFSFSILFLSDVRFWGGSWVGGRAGGKSFHSSGVFPFFLKLFFCCAILPMCWRSFRSILSQLVSPSYFPNVFFRFSFFFLLSRPRSSSSWALFHGATQHCISLDSENSSIFSLVPRKIVSSSP